MSVRIIKAWKTDYRYHGDLEIIELIPLTPEGEAGKPEVTWVVHNPAGPERKTMSITPEFVKELDTMVRKLR